MSLETFFKEDVVAAKPEALKSPRKAEALYEAAIPPEGPSALNALLWLWTAAGLTGLIWFSWGEPFSARLFAEAKAAGRPAWLFDFVLTPLVMGARGILFVEAFGYVYHRFFQHLGRLTRRAQLFRRNQRYHWMHHMILYPIGRFYKRSVPYVSSEGGLGLSWLAPALGAIGLAVATMGLHVKTLAFLGAAVLYAKYAVDLIHERFHETAHPWQDYAYFQWMEKIHILHHWDQRMNFSIVYPLMDMLFGTYLSPRTHVREIQVSLEDRELTVSDLINWRYLLIEATPTEYATFISEARRHPRSLRKVGHLMEILRYRIESRPSDALARELRLRAADLLNAVHAG